MRIISRKVQLYVVPHDGTAEERDKEVKQVFTDLRSGMEAQNKAYNILVSEIYSATMRGASTDEIKLLQKRGSRNPKKDEPEYSLYDFNDIKFMKGIPSASKVQRYADADMKKAWKSGLRYGLLSLQNRRKDAPLWVIPDNLKYRHNCSSDSVFYDLLMNGKTDIFIDFVQGITFGVVLGNPYKGHENRLMWKRIFEGLYKIGTSSIQIDKRGKIILNLALNIPVEEKTLDKSVVVGVDLGIKIPAMCALNNDEHQRCAIGSIDDFLRVRTSMQAERRRIQKALKNGTSSGHGRQKKLKNLENIGHRESNFASTYNHMVSKRVVDFALKNNAGTIHIENLEGFGQDERNANVLRNWSYYQLQQYITYKAEAHGIEVKKINPYHTSQRCSICGSEVPGQRLDQETFCCADPNCRSHKIYFNDKFGKEYFNADFNAARNIAMSVEYSEGKKTKKSNKEQHENK